MTGIVSFEDVKDLRSVAENFSTSLGRFDNEDIAFDFPGTVRRYTGDADGVHTELRKTLEQCRRGVREQSIVYAGEIAVGLSSIQLVDGTPDDIGSDVPNLSGMIFNPWRGKGFGSLSPKYRLDIVDERFNGMAYSLVRKDNIVSQKLVESNKLVIIGENETQFTYLYDSNEQ